MDDLESQLAAMLSRRAESMGRDGGIGAVVAEAQSPRRRANTSRTTLLAVIAVSLIVGVGLVGLARTGPGTKNAAYVDGATSKFSASDQSSGAANPLIADPPSETTAVDSPEPTEAGGSGSVVDADQTGTTPTVPTTSTTAPPTTTGVGPTGAPSDEYLIFEDGFEDGYDKWRAVPAKARLTGTSREGDKALHVEAYPDQEGSHFVSSGTSYAWNNEYWVGFSLNVPVAPTGYRIINQHQSTPHTDPATGERDWSCGAGPDSFTVKIVDGQFEIRTSTTASNVSVTPPIGSAAWGTRAATAPFELNKWHDFVLHFRYAPDNTGFMEVWIDGKQVVNVKNSPTVYSKDRCGLQRTERQYQKIGINHGAADPGGEVIYDAFRVGNEHASYIDVAPR